MNFNFIGNKWTGKDTFRIYDMTKLNQYLVPRFQEIIKEISKHDIVARYKGELVKMRLKMRRLPYLRNKPVKFYIIVGEIAEELETIINYLKKTGHIK